MFTLNMAEVLNNTFGYKNDPYEPKPPTFYSTAVPGGDQLHFIKCMNCLIQFQNAVLVGLKVVGRVNTQTTSK